LNTGSLRITKPSLGAWTSTAWAVKPESSGFISLRTGGPAAGGATTTARPSCRALPGHSVNTQAQNVQQMIQNIRNNYVSKAEQRRQLDFIHSLNSLHEENLQRTRRLSRASSLSEIAFRMQAEPPMCSTSPRNRPMSRRLRQQPARQAAAHSRAASSSAAYASSDLGRRHGWTHHQAPGEDRITASRRDRPAAGRAPRRLKQRGLLDSTLVIWGV